MSAPRHLIVDYGTSQRFQAIHNLLGPIFAPRNRSPRTTGPESSASIPLPPPPATNDQIAQIQTTNSSTTGQSQAQLYPDLSTQRLDTQTAADRVPSQQHTHVSYANAQNASILQTPHYGTAHQSQQTDSREPQQQQQTPIAAPGLSLNQFGDLRTELAHCSSSPPPPHHHQTPAGCRPTTLTPRTFHSPILPALVPTDLLIHVYDLNPLRVDITITTKMSYINLSFPQISRQPFPLLHLLLANLLPPPTAQFIAIARAHDPEKTPGNSAIIVEEYWTTVHEIEFE